MQLLIWKRVLLAIGLALPLASQTVSVTVQNSVDTSVGLHGRHNLFMSTSFQPAEWTFSTFQSIPGATVPLNKLLPRHIRLQAVSQAIPQTDTATWDFTELDGMLPYIQGAADHSPEFQFAAVPPYLGAAQEALEAPAVVPLFVDYAKKMVQYYNTGGFDVNGTHFQSPVPYPFTWWGILNEPDGNYLDVVTYTNVYNTLVPQLKSIDPGMKAVALELSYDAPDWVPPFLQTVTAPVDAVALHHYPTCNQSSSDADLFASTAGFIQSSLQYTIDQLQATKGFENVPVWITENNVNADYEGANGMSTCQPNQKFVLDTRGSSAFFAAWRPYMYSQAAKAGAQSLHHWVFAADKQYGEIDQSSGNLQLPLWVDYYLARFFPVPPGLDILKTSSSDPNIEVLTGRNADGSVVVMAANRSVASSSDNNGPGVPRTVNIDLSALGSFTFGTQVVIDSTTDAAGGPKEVSFQPGTNLQVSLNGYSVVFAHLGNRHATLSSAAEGGGVVGAASNVAGAVAPGEVVAIRGAALGTPGFTPMTYEHPKMIGTNIAGTRVLFDGQPAALLAASASEVVAVVPYSAAGNATTQVQVDYLGDMSAPVSVPVASTSPAVFTVSGTGTGQAVAENQAGSMNLEINPAHAGDTLRLYATGEGVTNSPYDAVLAGATPPQPVAQVTASIGGQTASVSRASGVTGMPPGILEVDVVVPSGLPAGPAEVLLTIGGATSPKGVTVSIE